MRCLLAMRWFDLLSDWCSLRAYPQRVLWLGLWDASGCVRVSLCFGAGCPAWVGKRSAGILVCPCSYQRRVPFINVIRLDVVTGSVGRGIRLRAELVPPALDVGAATSTIAHASTSV